VASTIYSPFERLPQQQLYAPVGRSAIRGCVRFHGLGVSIADGPHMRNIEPLAL